MALLGSSHRGLGLRIRRSLHFGGTAGVFRRFTGSRSGRTVIDLAGQQLVKQLMERKIQRLNELYGREIVIGGTGADLETSLANEVDRCFPDYTLYAHTHHAIGFLTRGCNKRCDFCVVPTKEGRLQTNYSNFDDFVPKGQQNVMLLDNNLLASPTASDLLTEAVKRQFKINFSQTLDIQYLNEELYDATRCGCRRRGGRRRQPGDDSWDHHQLGRLQARW